VKNLDLSRFFRFLRVKYKPTPWLRICQHAINHGKNRTKKKISQGDVMNPHKNSAIFDESIRYGAVCIFGKKHKPTTIKYLKKRPFIRALFLI